MSAVQEGHPHTRPSPASNFGVRLSPPVHRDSVPKVSQHVDPYLTFIQRFRAHDGDPSFRSHLFLFEISLKCCKMSVPVSLNPLKPNDIKKRRTAQLTSRCCILYIYSTNIHTEYIKHAALSPFFLFKIPLISQC